jgi:HD superfamily phosphohydrolase YqeK
MQATSHQRDPRHAARTTRDTLRTDMEAVAHAVFVADEAHVHQAINSVHWERRGLLQRLTRRAR